MLITCKECSKQISTQAYRCPHCGAFGTRAKMLSNFVYVVLFIGFMGFLVIMDGCMKILE